MTVPNAFFIFLLAFSGITGWLMLREPATISMADEAVIPPSQPKVEKPEIAPSPPTHTELTSHQSSVHARLANTILPILDLSDATLAEAIDFLQLRTADLAPDSDAPIQSLTFTVSSEATEEPRSITVHAEDISLSDALDLICEKAQCHWEIDDHQVLIIAE